MLKTLGKLSGKVAIITASTDGIGYEIARRLGQEGASIVVSSRNQEKVQKTVDKLREEQLDVIGTVCHVSKDSDRKGLIDFALKEKGGIDILVSNAATNPAFGAFLETSESAWDKIFQTNVKAPFLLTKLVVPHMEKRGGGSIVYVASIAGYQPLPAIGAYSISKTALLGLTRTTAGEIASSNIRVNCVCPGIIKTRFSKAVWENPDAMEALEQLIPMKRVGLPEEIAPMVSFLCSDDASYITGENFVVSGGFYCKL